MGVNFADFEDDIGIDKELTIDEGEKGKVKGKGKGKGISKGKGNKKGKGKYKVRRIS